MTNTRVPPSSKPGKNKVTLVFFIGGVTFTEIAALKWLSKQEGENYGDIVVATTKMVSVSEEEGEKLILKGNTLIKSIMEKINESNNNN